MRKLRVPISPQTDLFRHSPKFQAKALREAAEAARQNPYETPEQGERRARHYEEQANVLDGFA